jgi:hypothetical protein
MRFKEESDSAKKRQGPVARAENSNRTINKERNEPKQQKCINKNAFKNALQQQKCIN